MGYTIRTSQWRYTEWVRKCHFSSDWSSLRNGNHQLQQELFHKLCICKYYLLCLHCKFLQVGITYHGETNYSPDWESQKVFWAICIILVNVVKIIISIVIFVVIIIVLLSMAQITVAIINQEPVELVFRIGMAMRIRQHVPTCGNRVVLK